LGSFQRIVTEDAFIEPYLGRFLPSVSTISIALLGNPGRKLYSWSQIELTSCKTFFPCSNVDNVARFDLIDRFAASVLWKLRAYKRILCGGWLCEYVGYCPFVYWRIPFFLAIVLHH
jgi:hypothetical protein